MNKISPLSPAEILQRREDAQNPHAQMIPKIMIEINGVLGVLGEDSSESFSFSSLGYPRSLVEQIAQRYANVGWQVFLFPEDSTDYGFSISFPS